MLRPGDRLQSGYEFISEYHDGLADLAAQTTERTATVALIERHYIAQRRERTHYALGTIAVGQQWRMLKHSLAITTVNQPFTLNYRSRAVIQPAHKLTVPYSHIPQSSLYLGAETVRDHIWDSVEELMEPTRIGIQPFPIFLDHLESMVAEAKETGWDII